MEGTLTEMEGLRDWRETRTDKAKSLFLRPLEDPPGPPARPPSPAPPTATVPEDPPAAAADAVLPAASAAAAQAPSPGPPGSLGAAELEALYADSFFDEDGAAKAALQELLASLPAPPAGPYTLCELCGPYAGRAAAGAAALYPFHPPAQCLAYASSSGQARVAERRAPGAAVRQVREEWFTLPKRPLGGGGSGGWGILVGFGGLSDLLSAPRAGGGEGSGKRGRGPRGPRVSTFAKKLRSSLAPGAHLALADQDGSGARRRKRRRGEEGGASRAPPALLSLMLALHDAGFEGVDCAWRQGDWYVVTATAPRAAA